MHKISVIVPVYKVEPFIQRCVDSILDQTFTDHEPILVDDGSPDSCGEICEEYATADSRVIVIHQKNGGLSCARNTGIDFSFACSDSEWISFIDSDDWVNHHYLGYLLDACVTEKSDIAICDFQRTDGNDFTEENVYDFRLISTRYLWLKQRMHATVAWGKLFRKTLWRHLRYPNHKIHEDEYTTYKLVFNYDYIPFSESAYYYYFQNPTGIIRSMWSPQRLDAIEALHQQVEFFKKKADLDLAKASAHFLFFILKRQYMEIEKRQDLYPKYLLLIKREIRKYLRRYSKLAEIDVHNSRKLYDWSYPVEMKFRDYSHEFIGNIKNHGFADTMKKIVVKIKRMILRKE